MARHSYSVAFAVNHLRVLTSMCARAVMDSRNRIVLIAPPYSLTSAASRYATFCSLAGVDPTDAIAAAHGLPPIDSVNVWPLLTGATTESPRKVLPIVVDFAALSSFKVDRNVSAIILNDRCAPVSFMFVQRLSVGLGRPWWAG